MTGFKPLLARKALALTLAAGGALTMLGGANAQQAPYSDKNCYNANCQIDVQEANAAYRQKSDALDAEINARVAAHQQQANLNPYVKQAQAIFATNAEGSYKNPVANAAVKLYADAVSHGFANNPGLYKPFENYFDGLTRQNKDVFIAAFLPKYNSTVFNKSAYNSIDTYAGDMEDAKNIGKSSILELLKHVLTQPPSVDASINQQRQMFRVMLHQPLSNQNAATVVKKPLPGPGGQ